MLTRIGLIIAALGILATVGGVIFQLVAPGPDANIGAGALVVLGIPVAVIGLVIAIIGMLAARRRR